MDDNYFVVYTTGAVAFWREIAEAYRAAARYAAVGDYASAEERTAAAAEMIAADRQRERDALRREALMCAQATDSGMVWVSRTRIGTYHIRGADTVPSDESRVGYVQDGVFYGPLGAT